MIIDDGNLSIRKILIIPIPCLFFHQGHARKGRGENLTLLQSIYIDLHLVIDITFRGDVHIVAVDKDGDIFKGIFIIISRGINQQLHISFQTYVLLGKNSFCVIVNPFCRINRCRIIIILGHRCQNSIDIMPNTNSGQVFINLIQLFWIKYSPDIDRRTINQIHHIHLYIDSF